MIEEMEEIDFEELEIIAKLLDKSPPGVMPIIRENTCGALVIFSKEDTAELIEEGKKIKSFSTVRTLEKMFVGNVLALFDFARPEKIDYVEEDFIRILRNCKKLVLECKQIESKPLVN